MSDDHDPTADSALAGRVKQILRNAIRALEGSAGAILVPERDLPPRQGDRAGQRDPDAGHVSEVFVTIGLRARARGALYAALSGALPRAHAAMGDGERALVPLTSVLERSDGLPDAPLLNRFVVMPVAYESELLGIIAVVRSAVEFTATERRILDAFAGQVAISIENVILAERLGQQRFQAETVIEGSADGIVRVDADRRIAAFNPAMELLTGVHRWDAVGRLLPEVVDLYQPPVDDLSRDLRPLVALDQVLARAAPGAPPEERANLEAIVVARDGRRADVNLVVRLTRRRTGALGGATIYLRDVTRAHQLEQLRSAFLSMTSHELQTPVAIIKAYAESLERRYAADDHPVLGDALRAMQEECDRLSRLVANLLRVSRIEAGALALRWAPVDVGQVCRRVVRRVAPRAGPAFRFQLDLAAGVPAVPADEERIEEVILNLVDNAIKYSSHGGTITLSVVYPDARGQDGVEVRVRDQGPGIPMRELDRLFDRFYRSGSAAGSQTTGVGLGLYLSRAIVRAHGGEMWVESAWGAGATFAFTLPRTGPGQRPALPLERTFAPDAPARHGDGA